MIISKINRLTTSFLKLQWILSSSLTGLLLVQLLFPGRAFALDPEKDILEYNCQNWSRQNGLPANGITAIAQTKDGYLWLGTTIGLIRFDGIEFILLDLADGAQVRNSIITSLASAKDGGLWVGLENNAFGFYDGQTFSFRGKDTFGGVNLNVRSLLQSKDGTIWIAAERVAAQLTSSGKFEEVLGSTTNYTVNILCAYEDSQNRLWFGTASDGVYYLQAGKITKLPDPILGEAPVYCVAEDSQGQIWLGTGRGLYCYDAKLARKQLPTVVTEIHALLVDGDGVLWAGTSGYGLMRYQGGEYSYFRETNGLTSDYVKSLAEDREGSLWIGTRDGLSQLTDVKFPTHPAAEDSAIHDAVAVGASHAGGIWIGSSAGLTYFDGKLKTYGSEAGLTNLYVKRVFEAGNGDVYFVSGNNLLEVLSGGKVVASYTAPDLVVGLAEDAHGVVASVGGNLYRVGTNYFTPYVFTNGQPNFAWVLNLASGHDGEIWVASGAGIFRVKDGYFQQWATTPPASAIVQWICEDNDGVVWGAQLTGIVRLKDNELSYITRKNGLFDNDIYSIVPDGFGNLWVDSGRGIFRVSRKSMNDFADGKTDHVECVAYDGPESVKPADKTSQERVACKTMDGRIWFPGANGVVEIDPAHIPVNRVPPPVHINSVRANGIDMTMGKSMVVPPGHGELEFHFDALSFIAPQKVRFRYQLEGYDKDWVEAGDRRLAFYTNLKPGTYTFHVIAANADGVWNQNGDSLTLELRPYFFQTIWFRLLCIGVFIAALAGIYLLRIRHLKHKQLALQKSRDLLETEVQNRMAELAYERDLLRALLDHSPDAIYFKDAQSRFLKVSRTMADIFGLKSADELVGKTDFDFFSEDHARPAFEDEQKIIHTGRPLIGKMEKETLKDGREAWVLTSKMPFRDKDGRTIGTFGITKDITAMKKAEILLEQSNHQLQWKTAFLEAQVNSSIDGILVIDAQGMIALQNQRFVDLLKIPQSIVDEKGDENQLRWVANMMKDPEQFVEKVHYLYSHPDKISQDEIELKDGSVLDRYSAPVLGRDGKYYGRIWTFRDITQRRRADEAVKRLAAIVETSNEAIIGETLDGIITSWNPAAEKMFGYAPAEIIGQSIQKLLPPDRPTEEAEILDGFTRGELVRRFETVRVRKNGQHFDVSTTVSPIKDSDGKIVGASKIVRDITERKRFETQLLQSQRMETVGKLAGGIAHEFNSIMTAIIGQSELLINDLTPGDSLSKSATEIRKAAERAAGLTRQLLAFGRKQILQPEILNLNAVLAGMESMLLHLVGRNVDMRIIPAPGLKTIKADAGQIEQVIVNIVMNAADAMPNGGKLTLETDNVTLDEHYVSTFPDLKAGEYVRLAITDTGAGMTGEVKARVFEPFFTTKGVGKGTGLGLATCHGIIKQSEGHIAVYSEPGRGATFKVYLPHVGLEAKTPVQRQMPADLPRGTETILLVEDDPALRIMAATLLARLGYTVLTAADGVEALNIAHRQETGHIDLLFTDVVMPHMSGKELAERVQSLFPKTKILFASAYTEGAIAHQGALNPGVELLQKPFTPSAMARKVREMLDKRNA